MGWLWGPSRQERVPKSWWLPYPIRVGSETQKTMQRAHPWATQDGLSIIIPLNWQGLLSPVGAQGLGVMLGLNVLQGVHWWGDTGSFGWSRNGASSGVTPPNPPPCSPWEQRAPKHCHLLPCSPRAKIQELFPYNPPGSINIPLKSKRLLTFVNRLLRWLSPADRAGTKIDTLQAAQSNHQFIQGR